MTVTITKQIIKKKTSEIEFVIFPFLDGKDISEMHETRRKANLKPFKNCGLCEEEITGMFGVGFAVKGKNLVFCEDCSKSIKRELDEMDKEDHLVNQHEEQQDAKHIYISERN